MNPAEQWHKTLKPETLERFKPKTNENGVLILADDTLLQHVTQIERHRAKVVQSLPSIKDYNSLPGSLADSHFEWRIRALDLNNVLRSLPPGRKLQILDVGAWNGWLSHQLVAKGHDVLGIDYIADANDGLGARKQYKHLWHAIQMDVSDLSVFQPIFDVVILNHGLHFSPDPVNTIEQAKQLLKPGGLLIILCVTIYRNPSLRIRQVEDMQRKFKLAYGIEIFVHPTRGYLTQDDQRSMSKNGIQFQWYPQLWKANLKSVFKPTAPAYFWGVYNHAP